jgi:predicted transcriptional regulator
MSDTITIVLEPEVRAALQRQSRRLDLTPEDAIQKLIREFVAGRVVLSGQAIAEGLSVAEYLALSEEEEEALWDQWSAEADRQIGSIIAEAASNALPPR